MTPERAAQFIVEAEREVLRCAFAWFDRTGLACQDEAATALYDALKELSFVRARCLVTAAGLKPTPKRRSRAR